ncbi:MULTISPECIES: hypothetical protein [Pseudoalteromonas]|jgi:hypothetical protein|uniref:PH domain-containing protein n=1 Tax=Pseudoalteromonas neustonica TaxID=1840331 RepID=A0ABY3FC71_9GAMM|nr:MULTISPECIES: hypothetical protein [Pseudoalteromonas]MBB1299986.1 hypothetical protein [Pseudoalteromonas sp. SR44-8]MBB1309158.1 hypothetical protein [Pseudoalteromonas sp. SR41-8]MBB1397935.1 hypothetical protein [Pseudoalteromonas sp. SG44-8]MBB1409434.1 hypothetical protein [Pseudoalteromonas sp. SG44-17]MBB1504780.1 hypothetical protein [Pseudoalteromonas sp. SG41-1]
MNSIKLSPNWLLQLVMILTLCAVAFLLTIIFAVNQTFLALIIVPVIFIISILSIINLRFLHCYKAGIYYSQGLGKKYINADEIIDIQFNSLKLLTVLSVSLEDSKVIHFYNWQFDDQAQQSIMYWYSKKNSCNNSQHTQCNA